MVTPSRYSLRTTRAIVALANIITTKVILLTGLNTVEEERKETKHKAYHNSTTVECNSVCSSVKHSSEVDVEAGLKVTTVFVHIKLLKLTLSFNYTVEDFTKGVELLVSDTVHIGDKGVDTLIHKFNILRGERLVHRLVT